MCKKSLSEGSVKSGELSHCLLEVITAFSLQNQEHMVHEDQRASLAANITH